jgi:hypothetical protein
MLSIMVDRGRVRIGDRLVVSFQRTLRIPDDGRIYPLPPGLGTFPLRRVADYRERVPDAWRERDGVFIPMYQLEALWLAFNGARWKPNAVKVGIGGINAVSGELWDERLRADPQDYLVCPDQPWLDGINAGAGFIRQFVAAPLGSGLTVEGQLTGAEEEGGIQLLAFEPKPGRFPDRPPPESVGFEAEGRPLAAPQGAMGLGAGGKMRQKIYPDPHGVDTWDAGNVGSLFVHIVNSEAYRELTGEDPPGTPVSARTYTEHGLPWFDLYDEKLGDIAAAERLKGVRTIGDIKTQRGETADGDEAVDIPASRVRKLRPGPPDRR